MRETRTPYQAIVDLIESLEWEKYSPSKKDRKYLYVTNCIENSLADNKINMKQYDRLNYLLSSKY